MPVMDVRVRFTCPGCGEIIGLTPAEARTAAATWLDAATAAEDEMAAEMRRRLDEGAKP